MQLFPDIRYQEVCIYIFSLASFAIVFIYCRTYTKNCSQELHTECQFADDAALFAASKSGAEIVIEEFSKVTADFGMTVNFSKTKFVVIGCKIDSGSIGLIQIGIAEIEYNRQSFSILNQ